MWEFLLPVKKNYTANSVLFFFAKLLHVKPKDASGEAASRDKPGRKPEEKKIRDCWLLLFCLGTTKLSR